MKIKVVIVTALLIFGSSLFLQGCEDGKVERRKEIEAHQEEMLKAKQEDILKRAEEKRLKEEKRRLEEEETRLGKEMGKAGYCVEHRYEYEGQWHVAWSDPAEEERGILLDFYSKEDEGLDEFLIDKYGKFRYLYENYKRQNSNVSIVDGVKKATYTHQDGKTDEIVVDGVDKIILAVRHSWLTDYPGLIYLPPNYEELSDSIYHIDARWFKVGDDEYVKATIAINGDVIMLYDIYDGSLGDAGYNISDKHYLIRKTSDGFSSIMSTEWFDTLKIRDDKLFIITSVPGEETDGGKVYFYDNGLEFLCRWWSTP